MRFEPGLSLRSWLNAEISVLTEKRCVHLSIIDLKDGHAPHYAGVLDTDPTYPASLYKLFVAMGLMHKIVEGAVDFGTQVEVNEINAVDKVKELHIDSRPLLMPGEVVTVGYLLDLMITRSDNTAANVLIDLVRREYINQLIHNFGWNGSEVTRKFLSREKEDEEYRGAPITVTKTRHLSELLFLLHRQDLASAEMSIHLKELMYRQLDASKIRSVLPSEVKFAHKTGWFSYNRNGRITGVVGDCGIIERDTRAWLVACIVDLPNEEGIRVIRKVGEIINSWIEV